MSYAKGQGVKQDYKKAIELFKKACDLGDATGCYNLGVFYAKGQGVKQDYKKAAELFKKACDSGNVIGCHNYIIIKKLGY